MKPSARALCHIHPYSTQRDLRRLQNMQEARKRKAAHGYLRSMDCGCFLTTGRLRTAHLVEICKLVRDANRPRKED